MPETNRSIGGDGLEQGGMELGNDVSRKDLSIKNAGDALTDLPTMSADNDDTSLEDDELGDDELLPDDEIGEDDDVIDDDTSLSAEEDDMDDDGDELLGDDDDDDEEDKNL